MLLCTFFQYFVYGGYFIVISIFYIIIGIINIIQHCKKGIGFKIWKNIHRDIED